MKKIFQNAWEGIKVTCVLLSIILLLGYFVLIQYSDYVYHKKVWEHVNKEHQ